MTNECSLSFAGFGQRDAMFQDAAISVCLEIVEYNFSCQYGKALLTPEKIGVAVQDPHTSFVLAMGRAQP